MAWTSSDNVKRDERIRALEFELRRLTEKVYKLERSKVDKEGFTRDNLK